jgi:hypothetical protein
MPVIEIDPDCIDRWIVPSQVSDDSIVPHNERHLI